MAGDGRTSHIKVSHKLDMLGIGAANMHDPNGIAWKQNNDFENLLRRLNEVADGKEEEDVGTNVEGFISQGKGGEVPEETVERVGKSEKNRKRKERAREEQDKMDGENEDEDEKKKEKDSEEKRRKRRDKKDKEHKSKKRKTSKSEESTQEAPISSAPPIIPRHRP